MTTLKALHLRVNIDYMDQEKEEKDVSIEDCVDSRITLIKAKKV